MEEVIFTFSSTNAAIKAETVLIQAGLAVKVMSLPSSIKAGCGICLRFQPNQARVAIQTLDQSGTTVSELWMRTTDNSNSRYKPLSRENL